MNLSINAIRGLVLAANVLLLGLIGWAVYDTFFHVDESLWEVEIPKYERYAPPEIAVDERQQQQQLYKVVHRAFDPPAPKPEPAPERPAEVRGPDAKQIKVGQVNFTPENPLGSSAYLLPPGGGVGHYYMPGQELTVLPGFEMFRGVKVKEIRENGDVVLVTPDGREVVLDGPKSSEASTAAGAAKKS